MTSATFGAGRPHGARGRTQIFLASTLHGAAAVAAALDADCFEPAGRRLLLVANTAATPETTAPLDTMPGFEQLRARFDRVLSWNETISPVHPGTWAPRPDDVPLWERQLRLLWDLGNDEVELAVESVHANPAFALTQIFPDAPVDVYADGLTSYGPTRDKLDPLLGTRIRRLLHLHLVPGLTPLLLTEFATEPQIVPADAFVKVLGQLAETAPVPRIPQQAADPALVLGQDLAAPGILTAEEEEQLQVAMLRGTAALGHQHIVFAPHPNAPARRSRMLQQEAGELGVQLTVPDPPVLAEVLYQRMRPALVVGCFSTALLTASTLYGLPVARTGTGLLLDRLDPYQNSNRVPVTIVDALLPDLDDRAAVESWSPATPEEVAERLTGLVKAVGYAMQPQVHPRLRPEAEHYLSTRLDAHTWRYFQRRRLTSLMLPGAVPPQLAALPRSAAVRRVARRARALQRRLVRKTAPE